MVENVEITNNIFNITGSFSITISLDARYSGLLKNNVLQAFYGTYVQNFYVLNNISNSFGGAQANSFTNCVVEYNVGTNANHYITPSGTGNTFGMGNQTKTLAQIAFTTTNTNDAYWQLAVASECIGAGKSGTRLWCFRRRLCVQTQWYSTRSKYLRTNHCSDSCRCYFHHRFCFSQRK